MYHHLKAIMLGTVLILSVPASGQDRDDRDKHADRQERYEDRAHGDSHEWNENEDRAYRKYLEEHHKKHHDFSKAKRNEQEDYWNWRHSHPEYDRR